MKARISEINEGVFVVDRKNHWWTPWKNAITKGDAVARFDSAEEAEEIFRAIYGFKARVVKEFDFQMNMKGN